MKSVLIIDDDLVLQKILIKMLRGYSDQIEVKCFDDGSHGIEYLSITSLYPDLIFLDINMPEMNAWQFLEAYKKLNINIDIPVYILSSSIDDRDISKADDIGLVKEYLVKPLKKDELGDICRKELAI